jgi:hypothetical protein
LKKRAALLVYSSSSSSANCTFANRDFNSMHQFFVFVLIQVLCLIRRPPPCGIVSAGDADWFMSLHLKCSLHLNCET